MLVFIVQNKSSHFKIKIFYQLRLSENLKNNAKNEQLSIYFFNLLKFSEIVFGL